MNEKITRADLLDMLYKRNKIIVAMASFIAEKDIEEDICNKVSNYNCDNFEFGVCESCIIRYFKNKVEEEEG